ncbi:MAG TPA: helix-turn-helix domain-containing protein [Blastocatellia bacterium]|nr:helix-turn-helix domain-containing protein [Blastocatellia bacterium]
MGKPRKAIYEGLWGRIVSALGTDRNGEIAKRLGIKTASVSEWKHHDLVPSLENLLLIARETGRSVEWLLLGTREAERGWLVRAAAPFVRQAEVALNRNRFADSLVLLDACMEVVVSAVWEVSGIGGAFSEARRSSEVLAELGAIPPDLGVKLRVWFEWRDRAAAPEAVSELARYFREILSEASALAGRMGHGEVAG